MSLSAILFLAVGLFISSSLVLESISRYQEEVLTECVCWCLILICSKAHSSFVSKSLRQLHTSELGTIAFGVTLLCLSCSVQQQTIWSLAPLIPLVSIVLESRTAKLPQHEDSESSKVDTAGPGSARKRTIILCIFAGVTIAALSQHDTLFGIRLKLCWLFAQIVLYWGLFRRSYLSNATKPQTITEALHTASELAHYMILVTFPLVLLWWQGVPSIPHVGVVGILKASRWIAVLVLTHESKLSTVGWATVFSVCATATRIYPNGWQAAFTVISALFALYCVSATLPQNSLSGLAIILLFALYPIWTYGAQNGLLLHQVPTFQPLSLGGTSQRNGSSSGNYTPSTGSHHPVYQLAEEASARFDKIQQRQSQSLEAAVAEYRQRYNRSPPRGFDEWYKFAIQNDIQWIDEYDYLTKSLERFWEMPPNVLREYVEQALAIDGANLNALVIKDHRASLSRGSFQHSQIVQLLKPVVHLLPDLKAVLNELDEPRILIPHDMPHSSPPNHLGPSNTETQPVYISDQAKQIIWNSVTMPCAPDSLARSSLIEPKNDNLWPPFISNLTQSQDICFWPASNSRKHGFLSSPSTFKYTDRLAPILSTAKLSTFQDIMIPSSYYFQTDIAQYDESKDPPWEEKKDMVYWRGSGTGGHWTKGSWRMGHRQRFVNFTNSPAGEIRLLKESRPGQWDEYRSTMEDMKDKFKVEFSNFIQCDDQDCRDQEAFFHKVKSDTNNDANQYKILYNLDGNSFSGRYYRFLKSNSLVFMQALFKEWHDDRLIPWVHFVPISLSMEELPEISRYLLDDPEGRVVAARIAAESREWSRRVLRPIDLTAAYFRVLLEYARLLDDGRDTMTCC